MHPVEIPIQRPDEGPVLLSERADDQIAEAKSLARCRGALDPLVHRLPRLLGRVGDRQRRQRLAKTRAVGVRRAAQQLEAHRQRQEHFVGIQKCVEDARFRALFGSQRRDPDRGVNRDHRRAGTRRRLFGTSTSRLTRPISAFNFSSRCRRTSSRSAMTIVSVFDLKPSAVRASSSEIRRQVKRCAHTNHLELYASGCQ